MSFATPRPKLHGGLPGHARPGERTGMNAQTPSDNNATDRCLLTIITIHLDAFSGLRMTLESLHPGLEQVAFQWVVIDGGSRALTPDNQQLLNEVSEAADWFVSEPDSGIYAAMNKGLKLARGDYVGFLNAGDALAEAVDWRKLSQVVSRDHPDLIWLGYSESGTANAVRDIRPRRKSFAWWGMPTSHQAMLFKKSAIPSGGFDEHLRIAGDFDLVLRMLRNGATVAIVPDTFCVVDMSGVSNTDMKQSLHEQMSVRRRVMGVPRLANQSISLAKKCISRMGSVRVLRRLWK